MVVNDFKTLKDVVNVLNTGIILIADTTTNDKKGKIFTALLSFCNCMKIIEIIKITADNSKIILGKLNNKIINKLIFFCFFNFIRIIIKNIIT